MTETDYRKHLGWIRARMPSTFASINDPEFLRGWYEDEFSKVTDSDAGIGLQNTLKLEILPKSERFMLAWLKESRAEAVRHERRISSAKSRKSDAGHVSLRSTTFGISLLKTVLDAEELPVGERSQYITSVFEGVTDDDRPAKAYFKCHNCGDTGWVHVWSETTMTALLQEVEPERVDWIECVAACDCDMGAEKVAQRPIGQIGQHPYLIPSRSPDAKADALVFVGKFKTGMHRAEESFIEWNQET